MRSLLVEQMKKLFVVAAIALVSSCQRVAFTPADIGIPADAIDAHTSTSEDRSSHELTFNIPSKRDSLLAADQIESQMSKAGYTRCVASKGNWEVITRRDGARATEENRLLRIFRADNPRQVGIIFARQDCDTKQSQCLERFMVRQMEIPRSIPDGDKYVRDICENRSRVTDLGAPLKFP